MPRSRRPVSEKQLAAKSTGPRTPQGKARSSQNARKHGFTVATFAVVRLEDLDPSGNSVIFMDPELSGNGDIEITRTQNRNHALGEGFYRLVKHSNSWSLALRYQAQAERHYRRAVEEFDRLKALRPELPYEPVLDANPNQRKPLAPLKTNPFPPPKDRVRTMVASEPRT